MAASLSINISATRAECSSLVETAGEDQTGLYKLSQYLMALASGHEHGSAEVQYDDSEGLAAASGTFTLASVTYGDSVTIGGQTFTGRTARAEVQTMTFPAKASATASDYFVITDAAGDDWACSLDVTGSDTAPTGAVWTAIPAGRKVQADISGDTTAAQVAASVETAIDALSGFTALCVTDDTAADGTMTFTMQSNKDVAAPQVYTENDGGSGSISGVVTTNGFLAGDEGSDEFIAGVSDTADAADLAAQINAHATMSEVVSATSAAGVVTVTSKLSGRVGNFLTISESGSTITASGAALSGGTGGGTSAAVTYSAG